MEQHRGFMHRKTLGIILVGVGAILLAIGLLKTVPVILRFTYSNTASATLMINNLWLLMVVSGVLLCTIGLFIRMKKT
jgi:hypothetical protein